MWIRLPVWKQMGHLETRSSRLIYRARYLPGFAFYLPYPLVFAAVTVACEVVSTGEASPQHASLFKSRRRKYGLIHELKFPKRGQD
ncbi:hypothetical protein BDV40DRAFT_270260 [Aspergillus tamarii]|uniref:Uncharacterized protein n=1 Tax=Aspergillus tamarii TaxID=41984 RepID=A0A5N6UR96_ASPTM|nr:hypothetical protein BDV40DRAFT_270260 [Aspergillus tamarii]